MKSNVMKSNQEKSRIETTRMHCVMSITVCCSCTVAPMNNNGRSTVRQLSFNRRCGCKTYVKEKEKLSHHRERREDDGDACN